MTAELKPGSDPAASKLAGDLKALHKFWFICGDQYPDQQALKLWYRGGAELDRSLGERFGSLCRAVAQLADDDALAQDDRLAVAIIVALDQLPRNISRGQPDAFACDAKAQKRALVMLASARYADLWPAEKLFTVMPLMHAEDLGMQERMISEFRVFAKTAPQAFQERYQDHLGFAEQHRAIIAEFGRFPYRNKILGRKSTAAEISWLAREKVNFGQT